jgi:hypothetical protein
MEGGPESKPSKLAKLTNQRVISAADLDQSGNQLLEEMKAEWGSRLA